jgi:serine/threonine protein kinase
MKNLTLNKKFIKTHIDKKQKKTKLIDLKEIERLYTVILKYIKKLSTKQHSVLMGEFAKHKVDIEKVQVLTGMFWKIDNKATIKKQNTKIKDKFKKFEPKTKGTYCCFGDYKVLHELGAGAYGTVYLVEKDKKKYAIKTQHININNAYVSLNDNMKQIKNEIDISKKMGEMNIGPKLYDYYMCQPDMDKITVFIIMEWMTEGTLNNWRQNNKLSTVQEATILKKIKQMHEVGIVHADLHDQNIFVTKKKSKVEFYIGDFGLSKTVKDLVKQQEDFDIGCVKRLSKNNALLHPYIAKLFIICELI